MKIVWYNTKKSFLEKNCMTELKIRYNPYEQKTEYEIYSKEKESWITPVSDSPLAQTQHTNGTLRSHIEDLIKVIDKAYGSNGLKIIFEGTDSDFEEFGDYINYFNKTNAKSIECIRADNYFRDASEVLPLLERSFSEVKNRLEKYRTGETAKEIENCLDAFNPAIPICAMGLYSVGKSAFINAIIGREVLPSATDPTTAKVYKISNREKCEIRYTIGSEKKSEQFKNGDEAKIHDFLKAINSDEQVGDLIEVDVPFARSILSKGYDFVIYDTPGPDSKSNAEHLQVLKNCLEKQTNGLPVFVTEPKGMDKKSLGEIRNMFGNLKLDMQNILIVVNQADGTGNDELKNKKENKGQLEITREKSGGVFFVSSIIGIGAKKDNFDKNNDSEWINASYFGEYRKNYDDFSTTEGKFAKSLYKYNFMIKSEQKAYCEEAEKIDSSDTREILYYNSGIHCVERAISEYAEKYASYNKCKNSIEFFEKASSFVTAKIDELSEKLNADKKEERDILKSELFDKQEELKNSFRVSAGEENNKHLKEIYCKEDNDTKIYEEWARCKKNEAHIEKFICENIIDGFLQKWNEEIGKFSGDFWTKKAEEYKAECVKVITGSDITKDQKESLKEIIFNAQKPTFSNNAFKFDENIKIVRGFWIFKWLDRNIFSLVDTKLVSACGAKNIEIKERHFNEFENWEKKLVTALDEKMDEFNEELRKLTSQIEELRNNREIIQNHISESRKLLEIVGENSK